MKVSKGWIPFDKYHVGPCFRILNIPKSEVPEWKTLLGDLVDKPVYRCRRGGKFLVCIDLVTKALTRRLQKRLRNVDIKHPFGVYVSFGLDGYSHKIEFPDFIMEFYRKIGGSFDLSFVALKEDE